MVSSIFKWPWWDLPAAREIRRSRRGRKSCIKRAENRPMSLTLHLVNETTLPDGGPVSFRVNGKRSIDIGRAAHLDWTLPRSHSVHLQQTL
jgi:hypothetical protein